MEFSRQEYWSGWPFPLQGIFLTQGLYPHLQVNSLPLSHQENQPGWRLLDEDATGGEFQAREWHGLNSLSERSCLLPYKYIKLPWECPDVCFLPSFPYAFNLLETWNCWTLQTESPTRYWEGRLTLALPPARDCLFLRLWNCPSISSMSPSPSLRPHLLCFSDPVCAPSLTALRGPQPPAEQLQGTVRSNLVSLFWWNTIIIMLSSWCYLK